MSGTLTPREQAAFDAGFDAASKAFRDGARDCARQSAYALAELAAERERVRRWELRLRWRRTELQDERGRVDVRELDRLLYRQVRLEEDGARLATDDTEMLDMTMHGPRGRLP